MPHNNCCKFQEPTDSSETSSMHNLEQSICYNCHKLGHMSRDCPEEQPKACFKCGFRGHYYRECPSQIEKKCNHGENSELKSCYQCQKTSSS
ncbi:CCHC-type domain-containing protein [Caenorhabditis elegans]|uniref:CCHC-type domain-containing protein n=1 Tax=Caenorhabditis elegans TaxID=6239 RepID=D5MCP4_CAEEL|nr:CCHC-type domain-containing protein [Caenorhabditis elegans]CBL43440.1 CCHC-type domain-containing protein [Caenorhabditis elegans]|eukprot:NP_001255049.1 Uncharacterized protein CELE_F40F12.9 [Caenorhabditis elegans]